MNNFARLFLNYEMSITLIKDIISKKIFNIYNTKKVKIVKLLRQPRPNKAF